MRFEVWFLCGLLCSSAAAAQDVRLADLEKNALRTRPALAASNARVTEAKAGIDVAESAYAPTIALLANGMLLPGSRYLPYYECTTQPTSAGCPSFRDSGNKVTVGAPLDNPSQAFKPVPRYDAFLDVRGSIYDFGRTGAAVDAAVAQRRAAEADEHKATQDIVRDVRSAYVQWATTYALWAIWDRAAHAAEERKRSIEASIQEGARRTADLTTAASEAGFTKLALQQAASNLDAAREDLGFVAAMDLAPGARPADDVLAIGALGQTGERKDPALVALREQHAAAQASARVHKHAHAPVLSANARAGVSGQNGSVFPLYQLGVNMTVPLWGGSDQAERAQAEARAAQLSAQTAEYTRQRKHMQRRSESAQAQAAQRIGIVEELVRLCTTRVAQLEEGYPLGAATAPDVAAARAELQRAETELVLAKASRAQALLGTD